ncbi:GTPase [Nostoc sp. NMS8]|uniref:GTPase n=1 Tax=Nostoc sp. NMS8 TaxID=2815392 RepID=UPI0025DB5C27|nr:GTPase [Nostoc sp. NMS8]MBN3960826.1 50S ribosome-binding GTPase [Nostoc sp. NMS8]
MTKDNTLLNNLKKLFSSIDYKAYPSFIDDLFSLIKSLQKSRNKSFVFLLVGRTGVGKSSTINSLMGEPICNIGDYDPTTMEVQSYEHEINGIKFTIIDTPGLCDNIPEKGNDQKYIELIRNKVKQIDSLCFVTRLDDARVSTDEMRGIELISEAFTQDVWKYAVIIFTRANKADNYVIDLQERTKRIQHEIANYTGDEVASTIPSVAVDNKSQTTPDGKRWLEELYTQIFKKMSDRGAVPFFLATVTRINKTVNKGKNGSQKNISDNHERNNAKETEINFNSQQREEIKSKLFSAVPILEKICGSLGSIFGGSVGKTIGETIGGVIGHGIDFIFSLFS